MRVKVMKDLLKSDDVGLRALGLKALDAMLRSNNFSSSYVFEFGARSRDYGYHPRTGKDVQSWFGAVLQVASPLAVSDAPVAAGVRQCIAHEFRDLCANAGQMDALDNLAREIGKKGFWREGWAAVRRTRVLDGERMPPDVRERLSALEEFLRPKDLVDQVRGVVLVSGGGTIDLDDLDEIENKDFEGAAARMHRTVETWQGCRERRRGLRDAAPWPRTWWLPRSALRRRPREQHREALRSMASLRHRICSGGTPEYWRHGWLPERPAETGRDAGRQDSG
jgi:hypothetical protein